MGKLYLVASPLGNLGDASPRLQQVLQECDLLAAEDTRVARKLLAGLGIRGRQVLSVRQHNEAAAAAKIAASTVAYLCDAGTPGISDPGAALVTTLRARGFEIIAVPGPSAVTAALSVAGFAGAGHIFGGFLSRRKAHRYHSIETLSRLGLPLVFFEAPSRVAATLHDIAACCGAATQICLCRELTKKFEQVTVGTATQLLAQLAGGTVATRGEFTLVVDATSQLSVDTVQALRVARLLTAEMPLAKSCKLAAKISGANAKQLYRQLSDEFANDAS